MGSAGGDGVRLAVAVAVAVAVGLAPLVELQRLHGRCAASVVFFGAVYFRRWALEVTPVIRRSMLFGAAFTASSSRPRDGTEGQLGARLLGEPAVAVLPQLPVPRVAGSGAPRCPPPRPLPQPDRTLRQRRRLRRHRPTLAVDDLDSLQLRAAHRPPLRCRRNGLLPGWGRIRRQLSAALGSRRTARAATPTFPSAQIAWPVAAGADLARDALRGGGLPRCRARREAWGLAQETGPYGGQRTLCAGENVGCWRPSMWASAAGGLGQTSRHLGADAWAEPALE